MEPKSSAKQGMKKTSTTSEKSKKSSSKKKKKNKKPTSAAKSDQSPDALLEIEGVGALDQPGGESDSSFAKTNAPASAASSRKSSVVPDCDSEIAATSSLLSTAIHNSQRVKSAVESARVLDIKKASASATSFEENNSSVTPIRVKNGSLKGSSKSKANSCKPGTGVVNKPIKPTASRTDIAKTKAANDLAAIKAAESLRWENPLEDEEQEQERIRIYKINRRKRYLAAAQAKGLGWVVNYSSNGSPLADDSGIEIHEMRATVSEFSTVRALMPISQRSTPIGLTT